MRAPVLAVALTASLALNAWLLVSRRSTPAPKPAPSAVPADTATPDAACAAELARCRNQGWDLTRKLMEAQVRPPAPHPSASASATAASAPQGEVGAKQQRDALCTKGLESLRTQWRADRDNIVANLRNSLSNPQMQEHDAATEAASMADALGLGGNVKDSFERDYRAARGPRMQSMLNALKVEPPDLDAAISAARGLMADQDRLATRYGGDAGRLTWRQQQLEGRTVILAVGNAMADHDLEESVGW